MKPAELKAQIKFEDFDKIDIRVVCIFKLLLFVCCTPQQQPKEQEGRRRGSGQQHGVVGQLLTLHPVKLLEQVIDA